MLSDFESDPPSMEEQGHYLNGLLTSQLGLARTICSNSSFAVVLQKRLTVLQRIFYAVANKYHDREKAHSLRREQEAVGVEEENRPSREAHRSGSDALIEMGVKTGLSLVFSLLLQNWNLSKQTGHVGLCDDVLNTALQVVCTLPPLSLANESKLPPLGLSTMSQVTKFLKGVTTPQSGADAPGKRLASELVLALAAQRGSLRYLLEWIEMALCASVISRSESVVQDAAKEGHPQAVITHAVFMDILQQMKQSAVSATLHK